MVSQRRPPQLWRYSGLLERAVRHVDQFIAPSRFSIDIHRERGFTPPIEHLPYFTEIDPTANVEGPPPHPRPYFLFVGRLERLKGVAELIAGWKEIGVADLAIVGNGTEAAALRARAAPNPRIRFLGTVAQRDLGAWYSHAVACIVPSLFNETFGLVTIEAFAHKTPVIARRIGALTEVIEQSQGGRLFQTTRELNDAIQELWTQPQLRRELGENGHRSFVSRWSRKEHLSKYYDLLYRTAARKSVAFASRFSNLSNPPPAVPS